MNEAYRGLLPLIVMLSFFVGCAPSARSLQAPEPRPLGRGLPNATATRDDSTPNAFAEPTGELALRDALAAALGSNPGLTGYSFEVRAREAEALQAGLRPNPEIGAGLENFGGSGGVRGLSGSETTIALSQLVELGGKRAKRQNVALYEHNLAEWDYEAARIDVLTETTLAFLEVLAAQEQLALADDLVGVAEEGLTSVSRRVQAGSTSPVEESRARVELETSRISRSMAERALRSAKTQLSSTWGTTIPLFSDAVGNLEDVPEAPPLEALNARIEQTPMLARWAAELDHRRAAVDLARAQSTPDVTIGAGVRYLGEADDAAFVAELSLPLPFFDRNQGGSQAAALRVQRAEEERRASVIRVRTRLTVSHETLLAAGVEIEALRERALPEAEAAFQSAQDAYLRGSMRFTDVLDTKRLLFELKGHYFDALARYHGAVTAIEQLTGAPIDSALDNSGRP